MKNQNQFANHNSAFVKVKLVFCRVRFLIFTLSLIACQAISAEVTLPKLISDGMVLQRNVELKIWGWASAGEKVEVKFNNQLVSTQASPDGKWQLTLKPMAAGGPYKMEITGKNSLAVNDILVGEVWLCSGQSNMELSMYRTAPIYKNEIANCENSQIRQFVVPQKYNFKTAQTDLQWGKWVSVNPQTIYEFSAVAYFFGKEIFETYKVPVGLINASLGGSPAEAWISEESLKSKYPAYYQEALKYRDDDLIKKTEDDDNARSAAWYNLLNQKDLGYKSPISWRSPELNTSDWESMEIPGYWVNTSLGAVNGVVWFRKEFDVPASMLSKKVKLELGRIVDADSVFVNGVFVGNTTYLYPPRRYEIPAGVLKEGKNIIVIRVINNSGQGGFVLDKQYKITDESQTIDLKGKWQLKLGAVMEPLGSQTFIRWKPMGLYNGMINPLLDYKIKGIAWYQGESNATRAVEYRGLLPTLIADWRTQFNQGDVPFLIVQLANFMEPKSQPGESDWAMLREAQLKTLAVKNTGLAVITDIGEWNDIHPLNKKDVGIRLSLAARKIAYGETNLVYSGPIYQSYKVVGDKIVVSFANSGKGLVAKGGGELKYFAVAGADKKFVWAKATIIGNTVEVTAKEIVNPVAVRYAWADNPEGANLYNVEGLPASAFRTDEW